MTSKKFLLIVLAPTLLIVFLRVVFFRSESFVGRPAAQHKSKENTISTGWFEIASHARDFKQSSPGLKGDTEEAPSSSKDGSNIQETKLELDYPDRPLKFKAIHKKVCLRAPLCGSTNKSVEMHLESMPLNALKFLFHGMVTSVEFSCMTLKYFGKAGNGGRYPVCMNSSSIIPQPHNCLVYSFGISDDWSFDEDLAKYGCEVHSFDPSIGKPDHIHPPNIRFHNLGLMGFDFTSRNGWKFMKLSSIRKMLGHQNRMIDVLKIDAEGAEWSFLRSVVVDDVDELLTVKQLIFELHTPVDKSRAMMNDDYAEAIQYLLELRRLGFLVHINFQVYSCCGGNFTALFPPGFTEKCCYETSYVNSRYLVAK